MMLPEFPLAPLGAPGWPKRFIDAIAVWDGLRGARLVPARMDLDPAALRAVLPAAALLERSGRGAIRVRVAGGALRRLSGLDLAGLPLRALFAASDRDDAMSVAETAFTRPAAVFATVAVDACPAMPALPLALLPMSDTRSLITRALLILGDGPDPWMLSSPCRLRMKQAAAVQLRRGRPLIQSDRGGPARPPEPPVDSTRPPDHRAALRVIQGGKA